MGEREPHEKRPPAGSVDALTPPKPRPKLAKTGTFGRIVLDLQLVTPDQLEKAVEIQQERERGGDFQRLGHVLVEQGFLTNDEVQKVLQAQKITILACSACASQYNIRGFALGSGFVYKCPKCQGPLATASGIKSVAVQDQLEVTLASPLDSAGDETVKLERPGTDPSNTAKIRQLRRLGKYEILGEIARGGMGIIYKARQMDLERIVALKTLRQEELGKPESAEKFHAEARAVAGLRHPNIVAVHEVGTQDGIVYFTMEFIEGLPLDKTLLRDAIPPRQAVEVVLSIAEALEYAHRMGVVHRDLKPANIIVDLEGIPFLVDFGIAMRIEGPRREFDDEEDLLGSIPYMAPEYVEGSAYDELCDLYSLGVVLYECLAGSNRLPYYDDDTRRFLEKIVLCEYKPITDWVPDLDPALATIVQRMIAPRPKRHQTMSGLVRDLQRWLVQSDGTISNRGVSPVTEDETQPAPVAPPKAPSSLRLTLTLGLATLLLVPTLIWLTAQLYATRSDLADQQSHVEGLTRKNAEVLCRAHLDHARTLVSVGKHAEALELCTVAINQTQTFRSTAPRALAEAYQLRGRIRETLREEGAAADFRAARRLGLDSKSSLR